jgi:XPB/Ssl2-like helicase family protein
MTLEQDLQQLEALTRQDVSLQLTEAEEKKAEHYVQEGRVITPEIEDATLSALVQESPHESFAVEVTVHDGSVYIGCSCNRYNPGEPSTCAHIGAVLLMWIEQPEAFDGYVGRTHVSPPPDPFQIDAALLREYLEMLDHQTITALRTLARRRNIEVKGTQKEPIVQALAEQLCDLPATRILVDRLSSQVQQLLVYLSLILDSGYGFTTENIINTLHQKHARLSRRAIHDHLVDLAQQGLLLTFKHDNLIYYLLPQTVRFALPPQPGFVPFYPEQDLSQIEVHERSAGATIQSFYAVWSHIVEKHPRKSDAHARHPIEKTWPQFTDWEHLPEELAEITRNRKTPYNLYNVAATVPVPAFTLRSADRSTLRTQIGHTDSESEFYMLLLESLGAIRADPGESFRSHKEKFEYILSLPPTIQLSVLTRAWIQTTAWSEMDVLRRSASDIRVRRNLIYTSFKPQALYDEWRAGRQTVLRFLATIDPDRWVSVDGFLKAIFEIRPDLIHAHSDSAVWWLESAKTKKQFGTTYEDWLDSSGRFILTILEGPLHWIGAISLGYRMGKLVAIKMTPMGSFTLMRRASSEQVLQAMSRDVVQFGDDLSVTLVPGHAPTQLHDLLHALGELKETSPQQFVYQITAEGVLRALDQGQTIESLLGQISQWCNTEIPPAWKQEMAVWSQNYGKLHVYDDITLIELADDYALQELLSNTSLRDHLIHEFSPRLVAVGPEAIDELLQEMEKRGYTPHVE